MAGNALLNGMMPNMMQNNPLMQMIQTLKGGGNPMNMVQQMMGKNPQFAQVMNALQGKSPTEMSQQINQLASQQGVDLREFATQLGAPQNVIDQLCGGGKSQQ